MPSKQPHKYAFKAIQTLAGQQGLHKKEGASEASELKPFFPDRNKPIQIDKAHLQSIYSQHKAILYRLIDANREREKEREIDFIEWKKTFIVLTKL